MLKFSNSKIRTITSFIVILNITLSNLEKTRDIIKKPQNNEDFSNDSQEKLDDNELQDWSTKISSMNPENVLNFNLSGKEVSINLLDNL